MALVNVLFSVRRKSGELVPNLTREDFTVLEDGKEQAIAQFSRDTEFTLELGLLIDVSRSHARLMGDERDAASKFISSVMRPKDEAFLLSFGHDSELEQDFTGSAGTMEAALKHITADAAESSERGGSGTAGEADTRRRRRRLAWQRWWRQISGRRRGRWQTRRRRPGRPWTGSPSRRNEALRRDLPRFQRRISTKNGSKSPLIDH